MKKIFGTALVTAILASSVQGFAAGITDILPTDIAQSSNKLITVKGEAPANADVTLRVYNKGKSKSDIVAPTLTTPSNLKDVLYFGKQTKANDSGMFEFSFILKGGTGTEGAYGIEVNFAGSTADDTLIKNYVFLPIETENGYVSSLNAKHKTQGETPTTDELDAYVAEIRGYINSNYIVMPDEYNNVTGTDAEKEAAQDEILKLMIFDEPYTKLDDVAIAYSKAFNLKKLVDTTDTSDVDTLLEDDAFITQMGIKETEALAVYNDDTFLFDRETAAEALKANAVNPTIAKEAFENEVVTLAVGAQTKYTVVDIIKALNSYIKVDFTKYDTQPAKQEKFREYISEKISVRPTISEIQSAFSDGVTEVLDKPLVVEQSGGSSKPSSKPSGNSSSGFSSGMPVAGVPTTAPTVTTTPSVIKFNDLDSVPWAKEAITNLFLKGYIDGIDEVTYGSNYNVKREQFLKMLIGVAKLKGTGKASGFGDVVAGEWYEDFVEIGVEKGIVNGIDDTTFGIGANITRQDMAVMIYRALKTLGVAIPDKSIAEFTDSADIDAYATEAVDAMQKLGIITGMDDGSFCPKANATRAQAAVCMNKMLEYIK